MSGSGSQLLHWILMNFAISVSKNWFHTLPGDKLRRCPAWARRCEDRTPASHLSSLRLPGATRAFLPHWLEAVHVLFVFVCVVAEQVLWLDSWLLSNMPGSSYTWRMWNRSSAERKTWQKLWPTSSRQPWPCQLKLEYFVSVWSCSYCERNVENVIWRCTGHPRAWSTWGFRRGPQSLPCVSIVL